MFRRTPCAANARRRRSRAAQFGALAFALSSSGPQNAAADSLPSPALRGKSVVIDWTEARVQRPEGRPNFRDIEAEMRISFYVSTEGRVFGRVTPTVRGMTANVDQRVGDSEAKRQWAVEFRGTSMSFFTPFFNKTAVRKVAITFDPAFATCAAQVSYGKLSPTETMRAFSPITHVWIEIQSIAPGTPSCAVQNGNVFAN